MSAPARYFKNRRGNLQLIDPNGYIMVRNNGKQGPGQRVYYCCSEYKKGCKARAIVQDNLVVNMPVLHNHLRDSKVDVKLAELSAVEKAENLKIKPREILKELKGLPRHVRRELCPQKHLLRRIKRRRMKVKKEAKSKDVEHLDG